MLTLITGGAASGKSDYAEMLSSSTGADAMYYVATMKPEGAEAAARIKEHRRKRAGKDFITIECPTWLERLSVSGKYEKTLILLEDLGNLVANEQFDVGGTDDEIISRVMEGIVSLCRQAEYVYVVGDDIFSDTADYGEETLRYMRILGDVTRMTAGMADDVWQVIFGIAVQVKRGKGLKK